MVSVVEVQTSSNLKMEEERPTGHLLPVLKFNFETNRYEFAEQTASLDTVGGKALNLAFLKSLGYAPVPDFSAISSTVFKNIVLNDPVLKKMREHLCQEMQGYGEAKDKAAHEKKVFELAVELKKYVREMELPENLKEGARPIYDQVSNLGARSIAVRSSAKAEDLPGASFAGLYDSYLNIRDFSAFLDALKKNWASSFNERAVQYYMQKGIDPSEVYMSSVIMALVDGKISGTVFTIDITTGYEGVHVMASNGLEAVVGGDISADSYLFHPEHFTVLKQVKGSKEFQYVPDANGSGMVKVKVGADSDKYCLTVDQARNLAKLIARIAKDYQSVSKGAADTEYVIDKEGNPHVVQIRSVVDVGTTTVQDLDFSQLMTKPAVFATGKHSVFGVKHGKVKIVEDFHSLERGEIAVEPNDIVVAIRTENEWTQYLTMFSGIITTEGNPTSHPVLISREKGVPCLVGVPDAIAKFRGLDGKWVTLDGFRKCVYQGKLPLKDVSMSQVKDAFAVVEEEKLQDEKEMIKDLFAKGFMREEDDKYWITGINAYFSGALKDMVFNAYSLRAKAVNDSGIADKVELKTEQRIVHADTDGKTGKVYDHWWAPHVDQLKLCSGMELKNFQAFYQKKGALMSSLVDACQNFDLSIESWKKVRSVYEEVTAYQLLGFLERYPLIHQTYEKAKAAGIPRLFYEEYVASVPDFEFEEDVEFLNETKRIASELAKLEEGASLKEIEAAHPDLYKKIDQYSRSYKFSKDEDWLNPPPIEKAFAKLVQQAKSGDFALAHKTIGKEPEVEYFTDQPELREAMRLAIVKKLQQNDIHHVRSRAQWFLRDKLLQLGDQLQKNGLLQTPEEILTLPIDKLEAFINKRTVG